MSKFFTPKNKNISNRLNDSVRTRESVMEKYFEQRTGYLEFLMKSRILKIGLLRLCYRILDFDIMKYSEPKYSKNPKIFADEERIDGIKMQMFNSSKKVCESEFYKDSKRISNMGKNKALKLEKYVVSGFFKNKKSRNANGGSVLPDLFKTTPLTEHTIDRAESCRFLSTLKRSVLIKLPPNTLNIEKNLLLRNVAKNTKSYKDFLKTNVENEGIDKPKRLSRKHQFFKKRGKFE